MKHQKRCYPLKYLGVILGLTAIVFLSFAAGRLSTRTLEPITTSSQPTYAPFLQQIQDGQPPGDARELIPLPGPGQAEGQSTPAQCPLYLYQDGELFSLQPEPGEGPLPGPGRGGPQELIPLEPEPPAPSPQPPAQPEDDSRNFI